MKPLSIITGIFGMDAQNLASILLDRGHEVIGTYRYSSIPIEQRLISKPAFYKRIKLVCSDLTDCSGIARLVNEYQPDYIFNLGAMSHVQFSFTDPISTFQADAMGVLNILEAIRLHSPHTRLYQANTSELFGKNYDVGNDGRRVQSIDTKLEPSSPYGVAKLAAHHLVRIYREGYGIYAVAGILFNHTDVHRTPTFFERKVSIYAGKLKEWTNPFNPLTQSKFKRDYKDGGKFLIDNFTGAQFEKLPLGEIEGVYRDIGWSRDYMEAALLMVEQDDPTDYVVATGEARPLTDILKIALGENYARFIYRDPALLRPVDVPYLRGDSSPIRKLGWSPTKTFDELITMLVNHDKGDTP